MVGKEKTRREDTHGEKTNTEVGRIRKELIIGGEDYTNRELHKNGTTRRGKRGHI